MASSNSTGELSNICYFQEFNFQGNLIKVDLSQITSTQNSRLQVPSPDSGLVRLNGMYVRMQIFISEGESALVSNEVIRVFGYS